MRTELYKLQKYGGTLHTPLFAKYSDDSNLNDTDLSSIMYGSSILASFALNESQNMSTIYLPDYKWIDLTTMDTFKGYMGDKLTINVSYGIEDPVHLYQNGISTIVAFTEETNVTGTIEDLRNKPISLSVSLEGFLGGYAAGQVLIEESSNPADNLYEFYEIKAIDNLISIKQQNNGTCSLNSSIIDKIYVTFLEKEINVSCALLNDMQTVQTLYVSSYNATRQQAII